MTAYPVVLRLSGKRVLVVGGGGVAARKVEGLLAADALVTVVAPDLGAELAAADRGDVVVAERPYRPADLSGMWLVVTATDDRATQQQVYDDGEAAGIWVNAADDPQRCSFFLPAVHRREPVLVAVSTQGTSPALSAWLRDRLAGALPDRLEELVAAMAQRRSEVQAAGWSTEDEDWTAVIEAWLQRNDPGDDPPPRPPSPETNKI